MGALGTEPTTSQLPGNYSTVCQRQRSCFKIQMTIYFRSSMGG
uniref:Uncharacterized protein n=1 Tax=Rhizophora mucronata TaxID=61149 RepID=A0A2P2PBX5_RHIMU